MKRAAFAILFCLFAAIAFADTVPVRGTLVIAEVSGHPAHVQVSCYSARLKGVSNREYELAPFEQQRLAFADELGPIEATISVSGEGKVVLSTQPAPAAIRDIVSAPFKAAPYQDPDTGLIYLRDRWYDPRTGTFLTPDPQGYGDSANLYAYCGGDPINCSDPTGRIGESDLAEERRAIARRRQTEAAAEVRAADAAEKQLNDALHRFGSARMIELRKKYGLNVRARSVVAILPDRLTAITASGEVIVNPYAGRLEDETADLVMTVAALKVAAPVIATAFRTGGLRAGAVAVADEAVGQIVGINPSVPVTLTRSITNAFQAQRVLADLTRQVNAELAANPEIALTVLSRKEYKAATSIAGNCSGAVWERRRATGCAANRK